MANTRVFRGFHRVRQPDGTYQIFMPITTSDEVYTDILNKVSLTTRLSSLDTSIQSDKDTLVDDLVTILTQLTSFFPKPISLNHVYVDDFRDTTSISLTSGLSIPGKIYI